MSKKTKKALPKFLYTVYDRESGNILGHFTFNRGKARIMKHKLSKNSTSQLALSRLSLINGWEYTS